MDNGIQRFRNILLVLNPDTEWTATLDKAVSLSKQNDARLTLFSVLEELAGMQGYSETVVRQQTTAAVAERQEWLRGLALTFQDASIDVAIHVVEGIAFLEIIRQVLRTQHDLVITTAEEKKGIRERLFGTTTMHLMRKCPCPVWVVKRSQTQSYSRILAAVAPSVYDAKRDSLNPLILQLASSMARREAAELHVVNVWRLPDYARSRNKIEGARKAREDGVQEHKRQFDALLEKVDIAGLKLYPHLIEGDPDERIPALAEAQGIDLLVMGTVSRTGIAGFLIGNTAEEVLSQVNCSVLTIKPEGFVTPVTLGEPDD